MKLERRYRKQCVNCRRVALPFNPRCAKHREINRKRSRKWRLAHPRARWKLKVVWRRLGRCDICPQHRKLTNHKKHCNPCLRRFSRNSKIRLAKLKEVWEGKA